MNTETSTAETRAAQARTALDAWVREIIEWHFNPDTGCPFWLDWARDAGWDPRREVHGFDDLAKFPHFEDEKLRGGPVRRWVPKAYADRPTFVFETGGTTGIPKSRVAQEDFRIDYELFSETLPDEHFPRAATGSCWGPAVPGASGSRSSTSPSTGAASASAWTSTPGGSSSSSRRAGWST